MGKFTITADGMIVLLQQPGKPFDFMPLVKEGLKVWFMNRVDSPGSLMPAKPKPLVINLNHKRKNKLKQRTVK